MKAKYVPIIVLAVLVLVLLAGIGVTSLSMLARGYDRRRVLVNLRNND